MWCDNDLTEREGGGVGGLRLLVTVITVGLVQTMTGNYLGSRVAQLQAQTFLSLREAFKVVDGEKRWNFPTLSFWQLLLAFLKKKISL